MPRVYQRPAARRDLIEHYVFLAENASEGIAEQFFAQAEATFAELADQSEMGMRLVVRNPRLAGLRKWRVSEPTTVRRPEVAGLRR